ncbi:MAG: phosphoribosylformylglycinamidine synthase subunit PurL [Ignavibacteriae bacterium]|nr:MAG: phosphoribosylformylglycinamidine synthase subunit PurL [Ignavibacteriota bacterium]
MKKLKNQPVKGKDPIITSELVKEHGLSEEEYDRILKILGRTPTFTELGIFSVMWSEHCSYKNSIAQLKTLPRKGPHLLVEAGEENAGLVDIGDGLAVAFKIESHNHPSAVEPYQGAATGVGGILRDIFSMGARPVAVLNSLRFGKLSDPRVSHLFRRVVKGIADYGNSFGVPTVAGEVYFDESYQDNPLLNAMAVGIVEHGKIAKAIAKGAGNIVMIVGSKTGRDGIHGATFASEEISEKSEAKKSSVQVGDPFAGKILLEATLEVIASGIVVGVQDMGAAGITCSTSEMSARGNSGMVVDLERIPLREKEMTPYEILLSESQERMLFIIQKGHEEQAANIFKKWDIEAEIIGVVDDHPNIVIRLNGQDVANLPAEPLVLGGSGAPVYIRETKKPAYVEECRKFDPHSVPEPKDLNECLINLLERPSIASKRWVYEQYDSMVRTNSVQLSDGDAAVIRLKESRKGLALKTDCNAKFVYLNPRRGTQIAVAEAARNVACVGAKPIAITNCLNFGNPYDPEIYWQFTEAIAGMREACLAFDTPVTGGNVSFYNEGPNGAIIPTPVIGMLGLLDNVNTMVGSHFDKVGDFIVELGINREEIGGSEYLSMVRHEIVGDAPGINLQYEASLHKTCHDLAAKRLVKSMHDISDGGLAVTVVECLNGITELGCNINLTANGLAQIRKDHLYFGESQSRVIISCTESNLKEVLSVAKKNNIDAVHIGSVTGDRRIKIDSYIDLDVVSAISAYNKSIEKRMPIE